MTKTALITGITGQDGAHLSKLLLSKGYIVIGAIRCGGQNFVNLDCLGIRDKVVIRECDLLDLKSVINLLKEFMPDEIYNLASQSSVNLSYLNPAETIEFNTLSVSNLLSAIKSVCPTSKFYQASSSEMYGNASQLPINENTLFNPVSPYGSSKVTAHNTVKEFKEKHGIFACCGILFNHVSVLSNQNFFMKKIITSALDIKKGVKKELKVGNIEVKRDFGYAPDYVNAMWLMLQQDTPNNFIICSGQSVSLREIVEYIFDKLDLDKNNIVIDHDLYRPSEIFDIYGQNNKAKEILGWDYNKSFFDVIDIMLEDSQKFDLNTIKTNLVL